MPGVTRHRPVSYTYLDVYKRQFLRWISGIPFTEQQALRTRGDDYRAYQRRTSAFFPWFPKS